VLLPTSSSSSAAAAAAVIPVGSSCRMGTSEGQSCVRYIHRCIYIYIYIYMYMYGRLPIGEIRSGICVPNHFFS
jgi:hypothetical protein